MTSKLCAFNSAWSHISLMAGFRSVQTARSNRATRNLGTPHSQK